MKKLYTGIILMVTSFGNIYSQTAGDSVFNTLQIHTIYMNFSQPNYWNTLVSNKAFDDANDTSTYIPASVIFDSQQLDSVGIQFKGNSSYYNYPSAKKPFTLSFNEYISGQKLNGLKSINLNNMYQDPAFMREKLFHDFCNAKGIYCPRSNYARLYINGAYWGLYLMVERIDKTFLKDRFGNAKGNLFKGDNGSSACADLKYHGTITSYYNCYTLKTNTTQNNWTDLVNLTSRINNTTPAEFRDSVDDKMNTNSFISAWAAYNLFVEFDSYPYRFVHNYYTYHDSITDKFQWIVWDASTAFGMDVPGTVSQIEATSILYVEPPQANRPLVMRMLTDTAYKNIYLNYVCSFASNDFLPAVLNPKIDSIYNLIRNDVYADSLKMYSNQNFDDNITTDITVSSITYPGLKSFISTRSASVLAELNSLGYSNCPLIAAGINGISEESQPTLYPNPSNGKFKIVLREPITTNGNVVILDITGRMMATYPVESGQQTIEFDETLSNGIYFYSISIPQKTVSGKFCILK